MHLQVAWDSLSKGNVSWIAVDRTHSIRYVRVRDSNLRIRIAKRAARSGRTESPFMSKGPGVAWLCKAERKLHFAFQRFVEESMA